jgi:TrmH family RNA methyltransferase
MPIRIVQSKQNSRVKELRAALLRPGRTGTQSVAIEGIHLLQEALRSSVTIETVFVAQGHEQLLHTLALPDAIEVLALPSEVLASAVTTESPQPLAALVHPHEWTWPDLTARDLTGSHSTKALIVVLAGIQDPGNLGTILRSAEAFGATGAIFLPGTVTQWNPKAMRASAGSVFRLPLVTSAAAACFSELQKAKIQALAAMAHQATPLGQQDLTSPVALFIGSEGNGLSSEIAAQCSAHITIPCPGPVESLNAAVAASILLYEASRQRQ